MTSQIQTLPNCEAGYRLLHRGAIALARVEAAGIRVDEAYLAKAIRQTEKRVRRSVAKLYDMDLMVEWRQKFGNATNLHSRDQLGQVLVDILGVELEQTKTGKWKTEEKALVRIDHPFVKEYLRIGKLKKASATYLKGIQREIASGFIHPFFNLHTVLTFRSSSDSPNFQNFPARDPEIGSLVRRVFIPREGCKLIEADYKGIEVCVAACYHKDPVMLAYIKDPTKDMHRDMAAQCFCIPEEEVTSRLRFNAKSFFVFAQFYGDYFLPCAKNLWEDIEAGEETVSGVPVMKYLQKRGIMHRGEMDPRARPVKGSFEAHISDVESDFWGRRFRVYAKWKRQWYEAYQERGWIELLTGFRCQGVMKRNEATNYPIQGAAFHCLLQSLNQLVLRELKRAKLKSIIVGQIHDSLLADVPKSEEEAYRTVVRKVMVDDLRKAWPWIIVPLEVEFSTYSHSWAEKDGN